ncbi:dynein axonemal intermediate chain 2-like [Lycorma delicatula]|uniref:dynein axonemal intermediate chain 2-like n=1 Tax=Lycorma delicatula TaxID=130591 RepID=UPI003F513A24
MIFQPMEHCIFQNNAVNIYELYFVDGEQSSLVERTTSRTVNVFRDPTSVKRSVQNLSWSPDGGIKIAVTHCNTEFQRPTTDCSSNSYIWEVENPNKPLLTLQPPVFIASLEYNPKDSNSLVSGLYNGQVAFWDPRRGSEPVELSSLYASHRDPVSSVLWINLKSGTEFFSASVDGQVGTENGIAISGNRKGKTPQEKLGAQYKCHHGPVIALERNPAFVKNFLTVGDWTARIWSEDCKESAIIWTSYHKSLLTAGSWSPTRYSVFYVTRDDGTLDAWDILQNQRESSLAVKVCDEPLRSIRCHENGQLVAVGNNKGTSYLVEFSENLATSAKNDKALLTAMFERESRREKIIEGKMREVRLKVKVRISEQKEVGPKPVPVMSAAELMLEAAEKDFNDLLGKETIKGGSDLKDVLVETADADGDDGDATDQQPLPAIAQKPSEEERPPQQEEPSETSKQ